MSWQCTQGSLFLPSALCTGCGLPLGPWLPLPGEVVSLWWTPGRQLPGRGGRGWLAYSWWFLLQLTDSAPLPTLLALLCYPRTLTLLHAESFCPELGGLICLISWSFKLTAHPKGLPSELCSRWPGGSGPVSLPENQLVPLSCLQGQAQAWGLGHRGHPPSVFASLFIPFRIL